jgi:ABC-type transport system substrate-binding protein
MNKIGLAVIVFLLVALGLFVAPVSQAQTDPPFLRFIGFSTKFPPGDSLEFRRAIDCAINREVIVKAVTPVAGSSVIRAAYGINHPDLPGFDATLKGCGYDPVKAKESLAKSGWTGRITILTSRSTNRFREAYDKVVAETLSVALGVPVNYQAVSNFSVLVDAAKKGAAPVWMFGWQSNSRDYGYPSFSLGIAKEFITDPEILPLIDTKNSAAVEKMLIDKALIIPIIY